MAAPIDVAVWIGTAGWRGNDAIVAVAVAEATSGGNENKAGGLFGLGKQGDGQGAANDAHALWQAQGWGPFKAHNDNRYLLFWPLATTAVTAADARGAFRDPAAVPGKVFGALADAAGQLPGADVVGQLKAALALLYKAGAWLGDANNTARIAQVVIGGAMIVSGVSILAKPAVAGVGGVVKGVI